MTQAKVDTGEMRSGASTIDSTGSQVDQVSKAVSDTMDDLFTTWRSDAAGVFAGAMGDFNTLCRGIVSDLNSVAGVVRASADAYDTDQSQSLQLAQTASAQMASPAEVVPSVGLSNFH